MIDASEVRFIKQWIVFRKVFAVTRVFNNI
jgi:hypothetical protein